MQWEWKHIRETHHYTSILNRKVWSRLIKLTADTFLTHFCLGKCNWGTMKSLEIKIDSFFELFQIDFIWSLLKLQTSDRRLQTSDRRLQTTTDESQTTTDESQTSHRRLQTSYRDYIRITDDFSWGTDYYRQHELQRRIFSRWRGLINSFAGLLIFVTIYIWNFTISKTID